MTRRLPNCFKYDARSSAASGLMERAFLTVSSSFTCSSNSFIRLVKSAGLGALNAADGPLGAALVPASIEFSSICPRPSQTVAVTATHPIRNMPAIQLRRPRGVAAGEPAAVSASAVKTITDNVGSHRGICVSQPAPRPARVRRPARRCRSPAPSPPRQSTTSRRTGTPPDRSRTRSAARRPDRRPRRRRPGGSR